MTGREKQMIKERHCFAQTVILLDLKLLSKSAFTLNVPSIVDGTPNVYSMGIDVDRLNLSSTWMAALFFYMMAYRLPVIEEE